MVIDFSKQNTIEEKIELVYKLFERFNENYGNMVDMSLVTEALNCVYVEHRDVIPEEIKKEFKESYRGLESDGNIYLKENFTVDVLFHEVLHQITEIHHGLGFSLIKSYEDDEYTEMAKKYGTNTFYEQIVQLDESLTSFITVLAIPEIQIVDKYESGVIFFRDYWEKLTASNLNYTFLFRMYLQDSPSDGLKFKEAFGKDFEYVINTIEKANNKNRYIGKLIIARRSNKNVTAKDITGKILSDDEMKIAVTNAIQNLRTR